jgi:hypothetical protein
MGIFRGFLFQGETRGLDAMVGSCTPSRAWSTRGWAARKTRGLLRDYAIRSGWMTRTLVRALGFLHPSYANPPLDQESQPSRTPLSLAVLPALPSCDRVGPPHSPSQGPPSRGHVSSTTPHMFARSPADHCRLDRKGRTIVTSGWPRTQACAQRACHDTCEPAAASGLPHDRCPGRLSV